MTSGPSGRRLTVVWATPSGASAPHVQTVTTDPVTAGVSGSALTWTYNYTGDQLTSVCSPVDVGANCTRYSYVSGSPFASAPGPATLSRSTDGTWLYLVSSPIFKDGSHVVVTSYRIQPNGTLVRSEHPPAHTGLRFADGPSSVVLPAERR